MMKIFILFFLCFMSHMYVSYAGENTWPMVAQTWTIDISDIAKSTTNSWFLVDIVDNQIRLYSTQSEQIIPPEKNTKDVSSMRNSIPNIQLNTVESMHDIANAKYLMIVFYGLIVWNLLVTLCIGIMFFRYKK